ncbi:Ribokinase-like protein [Panaeolus papilionaceus]|nr:Ribokinase-like protein [Panaeolus papilionaceus]
MAYQLFCMGHPLLDIQVRDGEKLLEKYGLKANDAILVGDKHAPLYDEIVQDYPVTYVAGGGAQNAARGAAYILPPGSVVYTGAVGDDELAEQLKIANKREGLDQVYLVKKGEKTGACAVIITGHHRSLVTTRRAAGMFEKSHLESAEVAPLIEGANYFYLEGYFLTHGLESALYLSKTVTEAGKTFVLNFSAPYIARAFSSQLEEMLPYTDIVIGNEAEAEAWAITKGYKDVTDLAAIARQISQLPKKNETRPRIVVFTHGAEHTILVVGDEEPKIFPVDVLADEYIVDTNAAGDAFAGGFLGALVGGKNLDTCVLAGHALARVCVQQVGPQYPQPKVHIL